MAEQGERPDVASSFARDILQLILIHTYKENLVGRRGILILFANNSKDLLVTCLSDWVILQDLHY